MTKDEAKAILEREFGTRQCMFRAAAGVFSIEVIEAVVTLGGKYQAGWGITKLPDWHAV